MKVKTSIKAGAVDAFFKAGSATRGAGTGK
jgi:hypothetical protein